MTRKQVQEGPLSVSSSSKIFIWTRRGVDGGLAPESYRLVFCLVSRRGMISVSSVKESLEIKI